MDSLIRVALKKRGMDINDPYYDYRSAYNAGYDLTTPGHLPSAFKKIGHPRMVLQGIHTQTHTEDFINTLKNLGLLRPGNDL